MECEDERREEGSAMRTFGLPALTLDRIEAAKAKNPKVPVKPAKKSRKLPTTPRSRIKNALRQVWLRSRERAAALKAAGHSCERCGVKASVARGREVKLQVHHRDGICWDGIVDAIIAAMLPDPSRLEAVCEGCHHEEHGKGEK